MVTITSLYKVLHLGLKHEAQAVARLMFSDFVASGLSPRELAWWKKDACWFPHLREHDVVKALCDALPEHLRTGVPCEPQLLWSLPEEYDGNLWPHVDQPPPWANGRSYSRIVGVALSRWTVENGAPEMHTPEGVYTPELDMGDVLVMTPDLPHTRGINRSGEIRAAAYFRFLNDDAR